MTVADASPGGQRAASILANKLGDLDRVLSDSGLIPDCLVILRCTA
jgi:hypothetical protein